MISLMIQKFLKYEPCVEEQIMQFDYHLNMNHQVADHIFTRIRLVFGELLNLINILSIQLDNIFPEMPFNLLQHSH